MYSNNTKWHNINIGILGAGESGISAAKLASRVGASLLNAINLNELITNTEKEYENMAIELSTNSEKLKKIKEKLKDNKNTTPLFDTKLFTKNIESAYIKMNEKYLKNLPLDNIEV